MKKYRLFFVLLLSIIVSACTTQCPPLTDSQKADIEKQILDLSNKLADAAEKLDVTSWSNFLSSNEFLGWGSGGTVYHSREVWLDSIGVWWNRRKSLEIGQRKFDVTILSADFVHVDRFSVNQLQYKNDQILSFNQAVSFLYKKGATGWKIIHAHVSSNLIQ